MPKGKGYKGSNRGPNTPFSELPDKEKLRRARSARKKANEVLEGSATKMRSNKKSERKGAFKAQKAAERVEKRLTGKAPTQINPKGAPQTFSSAASSLVGLAKKAVSLPGKLKGGLESVKAASESRSSSKRKKGIHRP